MKTFQQFQEQATDRFKNTKDVIQGVFSGKSKGRELYLGKKYFRRLGLYRCE